MSLMSDARNKYEQSVPDMQEIRTAPGGISHDEEDVKKKQKRSRSARTKKSLSQKRRRCSAIDRRYSDIYCLSLRVTDHATCRHRYVQ